MNSVKQRQYRVGLFSTSGYDAISSPVINTAIYLSHCGYRVDLFAIKSKMFDPPEFVEPDIRCIMFTAGRWSRFPGIAEAQALWHYSRVSRGLKYAWLIGFDPGGLKNAAIFGMFFRSPFIYHSLEIICEDMLITWRQRLEKKIERWLNGRALLTLTQDEVRSEILARENHLQVDGIAIVPNSPVGEPFREKNSWLRHVFGIKDSKIVVLAVGSLIPGHMIEEIVESALSWPDQFTLVVHGWFDNAQFEQKIRQLIDNSNGNIHLSNDLLPAPHKYIVFQSADIGLVFYRPVDDNSRYTGAAAGKLFDFFRCGVPVIANDLPGFDRFITQPGCGTLIKDPSGLCQALPQIWSHYEKYRKAVMDSYVEYEYSKKYALVLNQIETMIRARSKIYQ